MTQARVKPGVPAGGEFTAVGHSDAVPALTPLPANPAAILASAVGSDKDPNSIPWPEKPANSRVEVFVSDDDLNDVLRESGYDIDVAQAYADVYASIDLVEDKDCDFYGITRDGKEEIIALGISDYEQAVDPFEHENLRYRDGFSDPMPLYLADQAETKAKRLDASAALLAEAGVTIELDDLDRGKFRLKRTGAEDLQLRIAHFQPTKVTETRNWHDAGDEHYASFLDGDAGADGQKLLKQAASLVAWDLHDKAFKARR